MARPVKVRFTQEGLDKVSKDTEGFADDLKATGKRAAAGFAAAFTVAAVGEVISDAMNIDAGVDKLQAKLGLTAKTAGKVGKLAGDTYAGAWGESLEEVQGFYAATMRAFPKLTDDALQQVTESAATVADVWDQDFNEVVRVAQQLLVNGLAPDAATAMDQVATALQKTKGPQDEVLAALDEYSTHFAQIGFEGPHIIGALTSEWATNRFAIDKVGDAIKEFGIRVIDGSDLTKDALGDLGVSVGEVEAAYAKGGQTAEDMSTRIINAIINIEDPAERARVGVALMGTPFEDLGNNAVPILGDVVDGVDDLTDSVEVGNVAYDNAQTKIEAWRRQGLMKLTEFIGGVVIPVLEDDLIPAIEQDLIPAVEGFIAVVTNENGVPKVSDAVADHLGVRVPDAMNLAGNSAEAFAGRVETSKVDSIQSWGDLTRTLNSKTLSWGEKFGLIWSDVWSENSETEQRNLDIFKNSAQVTYGLMLGNAGVFGDGLNKSFGGAWRSVSDTTGRWLGTIRGAVGRRLIDINTGVRVWGFVFGLTWFKLTNSVSKTVSGWGNGFVSWWRGLPGRILGALGNIGSRIKAAFMKVLGGGLKIPLSLTFSGDGLGVVGGGSTSGLTPQLQAAAARAGAFGLSVTSGFRSGSITSTGNRSYHGMGRAIDLGPPSMAKFNLMRAAFPNATELIYTPAGGRQLWHGQNHVYSGGTIQRDHYDHIHLALARGGPVPGMGFEDSVPAMLTPGEWVLNRQVTDRLGSGFLAALNRGDFTGDGPGWRAPAGYTSAVQELLRRARSGKPIFEDFSYRGMSRNLARWNDEIADRYFRTHDRFTRKGLVGALETYQRTPRAGRSGGSTSPAAGTGTGGGVTYVINVNVAGSVLSERDLLTVIRRNVRQVSGGNVQAALGR